MQIMIKSQRLELREIQQSDIKNIYKGLSHPEVIPYYGIHFSSLEATQEQMDWYADLIKTDTGIWWGIYSLTTQEFCGACGFNDRNTTHKKAEIGLWLLPEFWGKGYMQEAIHAAFIYGFNTLDLHRIEAFVFSDNQKCKNALEKINFLYEGTMREAEFKNGRFMSVDLYGILKSDFES